ncbi:hypothetical protein SAMN05421770_102345 [Granulicella rosea]|uniref:Uncharacterized protein n=1 Tax=Granulicella rosea TaxID=474952 RepID=A0A239HCN6_9BACT|nr:hypothetical protein [Granulicella rosea]SNS79149.1 hypothetical protein SAMN05421770_102345 [Granulicella rosea]
MTPFKFNSSELLISPKELVQLLGEKMDTLWKAQPKATNAEWTRQVKGFLREIAQGLSNLEPDVKIEVLYTNAAPDTHEFLLDLVWWCRRGEPVKTEFMALAAEIEWASFWWGSPGESLGNHVRDRVGEDFGKLTVVKSPIKLMIFCTDKSGPERTHEPIQRIVLDEIDRYLRAYAHHIPGEAYVLLDVATDGNRKAWIRTVDDVGILSALKVLM